MLVLRHADTGMTRSLSATISQENKACQFPQTRTLRTSHEPSCAVIYIKRSEEDGHETRDCLNQSEFALR